VGAHTPVVHSGTRCNAHNSDARRAPTNERQPSTGATMLDLQHRIALQNSHKQAEAVGGADVLQLPSPTDTAAEEWASQSRRVQPQRVRPPSPGDRRELEAAMAAEEAELDRQLELERRLAAANNTQPQARPRPAASSPTRSVALPTPQSSGGRASGRAAGDTAGGSPAARRAPSTAASSARGGGGSGRSCAGGRGYLPSRGHPSEAASGERRSGAEPRNYAREERERLRSMRAARAEAEVPTLDAQARQNILTPSVLAG